MGASVLWPAHCASPGDSTTHGYLSVYRSFASEVPTHPAPTCSTTGFRQGLWYSTGRFLDRDRYRDGAVWPGTGQLPASSQRPEELVARYAARWCIEVAFFDARQTLGVGQARNRLRKAVERTVPFGMICLSLVTVWYATAGHTPDVAAERRAHSPWYQSKTEPSFEDMTVKLRRVIIAARFRSPRPDLATPKKPRPFCWPGPQPEHDRLEVRNTRVGFCWR